MNVSIVRLFIVEMRKSEGAIKRFIVEYQSVPTDVSMAIFNSSMNLQTWQMNSGSQTGLTSTIHHQVQRTSPW